MSRRIPSPFEYRGGWRAQVTLKNGARPHADFDKHADAVDWILETLGLKNTDKDQQLGGPSQATLCDMLEFYLVNHCLAKGGVSQEIDRANHYLEAAGRPRLALHIDEKGHKSIITAAALRELKAARQREKATSAKKVGGNLAGETPKSFDEHNQARVASHPRTYEMYAKLAKKTANRISKADIAGLQTVMTAEMYSASTIQKEIALLKAMFNTAREKWDWKGFENPCAGIKLAKGAQRFVVVNAEQRARVFQALAECDNREFWLLVALALTTVLRQHSLLLLEWEKVNLEDRTMQVWAKGRWEVVPLAKEAVELLLLMPAPREGKVFSMNKNAVKCAWDGVRKKAGVPKLRFYDLRHVGATDLTRRGLGAHELQVLLTHRDRTMADIYVNLGSGDVQAALDNLHRPGPLLPMPPAMGDRVACVSRNKVRRLKRVTAYDPSGVNPPVPLAGLAEEQLSSAEIIEFPESARLSTSPRPLSSGK